MKRFLALFLGLALMQVAAAAGGQPNIVFIITDDMYPWQMNFMPEGEGRNYTPNIDRLADEGIVMRNQYVSSTVCTPSRYNVMTGRYASRSQDPQFVAELERLGQTHVQWNTFVNPGRAGFEHVSRVYHNNPDFNGSMELAVHNQDWITEGALEFLRQKDDRPFFLYFATTIPHGPAQPERSWKADRRATPEGWLDYTPEVQPGADSIARRTREHGAEGRETILWIDDAIGALLTTLDATGELEDTIIFFFNDHGQKAKGSVYQGGAYNPSLVWRHGGWQAGGESMALVSNIDFAPTMLDLARIGRPGDMDGVSFLPVLEGRAEQIRDSLFFEMGYTRGVMKNQYKYIALRYPPVIANLTREERQANLDHMNNNLRERGRPVHNEDPMKPFGHLMPVPGGHDAEQGAVKAYPHYYDPDQLYNLSSDPDEQRNIFGLEAHSEQQEELRILLESNLAKLPGRFPL